MAIVTSTAPSAPAAAAVVLVLLPVALRGVVGALLLPVALLLPAVARLLPVAPALGLPIAAALRTTTITSRGVAGGRLLAVARVGRLLSVRLRTLASTIATSGAIALWSRLSPVACVLGLAIGRAVAALAITGRVRGLAVATVTLLSIGLVALLGIALPRLGRVCPIALGGLLGIVV